MPKDEVYESVTVQRTTRRTIVKTGAKLAYAVPVVAASMKLSASTVGAISEPACRAGETLCNGACVDINADASNCGSCGERCSGNFYCLGGFCACTPGSCTSLGVECGDVLDGCGGILHCGT